MGRPAEQARLAALSADPGRAVLSAAEVTEEALGAIDAALERLTG